MYTEFMLGKVLHHQRLQPRKLLLLLLAVTEQKQSPTQKEELAINTASARRNQKGYADCSSLMRDAYKSASGKYIGNTTYEQLELMHSYLYSISSVRQATVGDLVFHQNGSNHVGIYLGNGKVLHASQTAGKVKIELRLVVAAGIGIRVVMRRDIV